MGWFVPVQSRHPHIYKGDQSKENKVLAQGSLTTLHRYDNKVWLTRRCMSYIIEWLNARSVVWLSGRSTDQTLNLILDGPKRCRTPEASEWRQIKHWERSLPCSKRQLLLWQFCDKNESFGIWAVRARLIFMFFKYFETISKTAQNDVVVINLLWRRLSLPS